MEPREHWRAVYESRRPDELSWFQASPEASLAAIDLLGAAPNASLVDIGAGASRLADALLDRGWADVTLIDIAEPALEATRLRLGDRAGRINWEIADVRHWRPDRCFDIWHDRAVFHFLTVAADRAAYVRALIAGTRPGSHVIIASFALDGPDRCSGLPVQRYSAAGLTAALGSAFAPAGDWIEGHTTPGGVAQQFQWCLFTRK